MRTKFAFIAAQASEHAITGRVMFAQIEQSPTDETQPLGLLGLTGHLLAKRHQSISALIVLADLLREHQGTDDDLARIKAILIYAPAF